MPLKACSSHPYFEQSPRRTFAWLNLTEAVSGAGHKVAALEASPTPSPLGGNKVCFKLMKVPRPPPRKFNVEGWVAQGGLQKKDQSGFLPGKPWASTLTLGGRGAEDSHLLFALFIAACSGGPEKIFV